MVFRHVLGQIKEIEEYQVTQTENGADILVVSPDKINTEQTIQKISENLEKEGLANADLNLNVVESLPRHHETGKVKRFIALKK